MEEYIKVLEGFLKTEVLYGRMALTSSQVDILKHDIKCLINKYKKQEKIIKLMAKDIHDYEDWTDKVCNIVDCPNTPHCEAESTNQELKCIIEYYEKKARGNNG